MICVAIPTRGRPQFIATLLQTAHHTATNFSEVVVKYYLNDDDPSLRAYKKELNKMYDIYGDSVQWEIGPDQNTVHSWNMLCESTQADYYILAGDEVKFKTAGWDDKIKETKQQYPDGVFCISAFDGRPNRAEAEMCTTPIVTKEWREALGYFWSPFLWHWHVDHYTGDLARAVKRYVYRKDILIEIRKMKDHTAKRMRGQGVFDRDEWMFNKHKELYFDTDIKNLLAKITN